MYLVYLLLKPIRVNLTRIPLGVVREKEELGVGKDFLMKVCS
jgi:hypothetical protein